MTRKIQIALLMAMLLNSPVVAPAHAQSPAQLEQQKRQKLAAEAAKRKWLLAQRAESGGTGEGAWQLLKQPMDLPDVPRYSGAGAQFIEGLMYPNKPGGAAISLTYRVKEAPDAVLGWYQDALANYQWKMGQSKDPNMLKGSHGRNGVTVTVTPTKQKGFRTDLRISYKISNK